MKKILNPKLAKEKITLIDSDSSSQENLKEDEDLSKQVDNKREDSVIEKPSLMKGTVKEKSKNFSFKEDKSKKVPVVETQQHEEDDEEIFRKLNIPWLFEEVSSFQEGKFIDFENENLQKSVKQYKYQTDFLNETNEGLVMENRRLREYLEDIKNHYQELIVVSKEALKRKRKTQSKFEELNQKIQDLTQQNQEAEQQRTRRKTQALEGIALLAEAAKDL